MQEGQLLLDLVDRVAEQDQEDRVAEQDQEGQAVLVHKVDWVDLINTSQLMDTMDTMDMVHGWAIPGIGGADMVIGAAGTTVAQAGGGIPGMAIPGGGGTETIGGDGYQAGAPTLVRTDPDSIDNSRGFNLSFYFFMNVKCLNDF